MLVRPFQTRLAADRLFEGGVLAYPTESVYGLGALPFDERAARRIISLKGRAFNKGFILAAANVEQLEEFVDFDAVLNWKRVFKTWPGPVTWILPALPAAPDWLTGGRETIAVRVSAHPTVQSLCSYAGPIISTSANPSGKPPAKSLHRTRQYFKQAIDYLGGSCGGLAKPTTIIDGKSGKVLR